MGPRAFSNDLKLNFVQFQGRYCHVEALGIIEIGVETSCSRMMKNAS